MKIPNVKCHFCNSPFYKTEYQIKKTKHNFCSKSCSAKLLNSIHKKKIRKQKFCKSCNKEIFKRSWFCDDCKIFSKNVKDNRTLREVIYTKHHKSSAYALIRSLARTIAKQQKWKSCFNCGYNKHIEICHIKGIHDFDLDTKVIEINNLKNLIPLCPNCHWEFDHCKKFKLKIIESYNKRV